MSLMENIKSVQNYHIVLSTRNMTHLGEIQNIDQESISINENFNSANELSFTVYKQLGEQKCKLWDKIVDLKLVYIAERNEYFQIECPITDSDTAYKALVLHYVKQSLGKLILMVFILIQKKILPEMTIFRQYSITQVIRLDHYYIVC